MQKENVALGILSIKVKNIDCPQSHFVFFANSGKSNATLNYYKFLYCYRFDKSTVLTQGIAENLQ
jgi:hypothetical protein